MSVGKQMQQLLEVMMLLKEKVTLLEETERQRVMQLEALRNREVATRRREDKEKEKVARTKEEEIGVKQQAIQHELEKVFDQVEVQIMEVSNKVAKEEKETVKQTNYHYQQKQKPIPPKAPQNPQKPLQKKQPPVVKRPSIAEQARMNSAKKTKDILKQIEELKEKKETVTGKVTEIQSAGRTGSSRSLDKGKAVVEPTPPPHASRQTRQNAKQPQILAPKPVMPPSSKPSLSADSKPSSSVSPALTLQSFHNKDYLSTLKQHSQSKLLPAPKTFLESYQKQQLGYRQQQSRSRLSFLKLLSKYAPCKRNVHRDYTNKIQKRGWKGCDYLMTFEQALKAVDLHEVGAMLEGKKPKAVVMYRRAEEISRLVINWRKIEEEKKGIVAPKIAEIHFEFNRVSRSGKGAEGNRAIAMTKQIQLQTLMEPAYKIIRPILQQYLQKDTLSKQDLKILVQLLNLVLCNNRKSHTVIPKQQLQNFLQLISSQM